MTVIFIVYETMPLLESKSCGQQNPRGLAESWNALGSHIMSIGTLPAAAWANSVRNGSRNFAWLEIMLKTIRKYNGTMGTSCINLLILSGRLISITKDKMARRKWQS